MRVIIVGAGPAGLVLAHALPHAGIRDFILLEKRAKVAEPSGTGLGLWPHSLRVLDQLANGVYEGIVRLAPKMKRAVRLGADGTMILGTDLFAQVEENHGHGVLMVDRIRFLQHLYEQLPDKSAVLTNKTVTSLTQSDTGVSVTCADGSSYEGDILVGADGVRSTVRSLAFGTSARSMPKGLSSTYQCIFGKGPMIPGLPANEMVELLDGRHTFQFLTANELVFWFLYLRTNQTVTEWVNYTDEELHAFAERHLDHPVSEGGKVTFGHLWRTRHQARLVNLEEGVLDNWHTGRVALLGDAVHKMTPNLALGGNNAIESVASLVNHLKRLTEDNSAPDTRSIEAAFASFQTERKDRATWCMRYSYALLRHAGAMNALLNLLSRFMTLDAGDRLVADKLIAWVSRDGVVLDSVPETNQKAVRIPYLAKQAE